MDNSAAIFTADCNRTVAFYCPCKISNTHTSICAVHVNLLKVNNFLPVFRTKHYINCIIVSVFTVSCCGNSFYASLNFICNSGNIHAETVRTLPVNFNLNLRKSFICVNRRFSYIWNGCHYFLNFLCHIKRAVQTGASKNNVNVVSCHLLAPALTKAKINSGKFCKMLSELLLYCFIIVNLLV